MQSLLNDPKFKKLAITDPTAHAAFLKQAIIDQKLRDSYLDRLSFLAPAFPSGPIPECFSTLLPKNIVCVTEENILDHRKSNPSILAIIWRLDKVINVRIIELYPNARIFDAQGCKLKSLWGIEKLEKLTTLLVAGNEITSPKCMPPCKWLNTIDLRCNPLQGFPSGFTLKSEDMRIILADERHKMARI